MSDAVNIALIAAVATIIGQFINLLISIRNGRKLVEIHTITNGNLGRVTAALETAHTEIQGLRALVAEMVVSRKDTKAATDKADIDRERK